jgi:hypothetical protein
MGSENLSAGGGGYDELIAAGLDVCGQMQNCVRYSILLEDDHAILGSFAVYITQWTRDETKRNDGY